MNADELKVLYEPTPLKGAVEYERQLWQARYSPCGRFLIACGYDATVQRWDVSDNLVQRRQPLIGHHGWVQCLGFAGDGNRLVTADSWGKLACWDYAAESPEPLWTVETAHDGWIRTLAVSPDGSRVATGGNDAVVRIWSTDKGELQKELPHPERVFSVQFHPDGKSLVSGDLTAVVRHWDWEQAALSREWTAEGMYQLDRIQQCGGVRQLTFDAAGTLLACAGQKTPGGGFATGTPCIQVFEWETGKLLREMVVGASKDGFAYDAQFHPAGFVMGTSGAFPNSGHLWFWHPQQEEPFFLDKKLTNGRSLSLHPDGTRLALLIADSKNANGRPIKDGMYLGGTARIHILMFPAPAEAQVEQSEAPSSR